TNSACACAPPKPNVMTVHPSQRVHRALPSRANPVNRRQPVPHTPIQRHYASGDTFRWVHGDNHIVVKRGYVLEGHAVIVRPNRAARAGPPHRILTATHLAREADDREGR